MQRRTIQTDGLSQSVLEAGAGPLVLLIHGFPELAISWEAQIRALVAAELADKVRAAETIENPATARLGGPSAAP